MVSPLNPKFKLWEVTEQGSVKNKKHERRLKDALDYLQNHHKELDALIGTPLADQLISRIEATSLLPEDQKLQMQMASIRDYVLQVRQDPITIKALDRVVIIPKQILINRAPLFQRMLDGAYLENKTRTIELKELPFEVVDLFLTYLKTGQCEITGETALPLSQLADQYDCKSLHALVATWFAEMDPKTISVLDWILILKYLEPIQQEVITKVLWPKIHDFDAFILPNGEELLSLNDEDLTFLGFNQDELNGDIHGFWEPLVRESIDRIICAFRPLTINEGIEKFLRENRNYNPNAQLVGKLFSQCLLDEAKRLGRRYAEIPVDREEWLGFKRTDLQQEGIYLAMRDMGDQEYDVMLNDDQFNALVDYAMRNQRREIIDTCCKWLEKSGARFEFFPKMMAHAKEKKILPLLKAFDRALNLWHMSERKRAQLYTLLQSHSPVLQTLGFTKNMILGEIILYNAMVEEDLQMHLNALEAGTRDPAYAIGMEILNRTAPFNTPEHPLERSIEFLTMASERQGPREIELEYVFLGLGDAFCTLLKNQPTKQNALRAQFNYTEALSRMEGNKEAEKLITEKIQALLTAIETNAFEDEALQRRLTDL